MSNVKVKLGHGYKIRSNLKVVKNMAYHMKGFFRSNITEPAPKVFVVIWIKGQGQSRPGPKIRSKFKIVQNMSSLVSN